jgi:hypothetical protein
MAKKNKPIFTCLFYNLALLGLAGLIIYSAVYLIQVFLGWGFAYHNTTTLADFNGDGRMDVVVAHAQYESESIIFAHTTLWTNQANGRFSPRRIAYHSSTAAGDLDGDGDADLLLVDQAQLRILLNQGGLQGGQPGQFELYGNPITATVDHGTAGTVYLGDLDNDGDLDGFVAGCCSMALEKGSTLKVYIPSHAWVWLNDWDPPGWLNRQTVSLMDLGDLRMRAAALGDLDGDGDLDVFAAVLAPRLGGESGHPDLVLLNDGQGNFTDSGQRLGDRSSTAVALGDLDGDGDLDALVGSSLDALIWINQGGAQGGTAGQFQLSEGVLASGETTHVFLDDLDGDGDLDALIAGTCQARIWWNDGHGNFSRDHRQIFRFSHKHGLAVGDFNGDDHPDIFAGAYNYAYSLWLNHGDGIFRRAFIYWMR